MIKIRKSTFETNSSSTHAIAIPKKPTFKKQSHVDFKWGEFGWEYKVYYDTVSKASYLYTMLNYFDGGYTPEYNKRSVYLETIKKYLDEENITYSFEPSRGDVWENGYVDHGGDNPKVIEGILKTKESFLTYLFDENAYVSTGNDNDEGYFIPGVGLESDYGDYDDYKSLHEKYYKAMKEYEKDYDVYYKGN